MKGCFGGFQVFLFSKRGVRVEGIGFRVKVRFQSLVSGPGRVGAAFRAKSTRALSNAWAGGPSFLSLHTADLRALMQPGP